MTNVGPRLLLVQPAYTNQRLDVNVKIVCPIGLGYVAAHVPSHWQISIVDEQIQKIDFDFGSTR